MINKMKQNLIICIVVMFGLISCDSTLGDKDIKSDSNEIKNDSLVTEYPENDEYVLEIRVDSVNMRMEIFSTIGILKRIQLYTNNNLDTMLTFYENGDIYSINTFWSDNGNPVDNIWIYFDESGDTLENLGHYYLLDSVKSSYSLKEEASVFFKINRQRYGSLFFVCKSDELLKVHKKITESSSEENLLNNQKFLKVPTAILGMNKLEFTINDCRVENDTLICELIKGVFEYEVVE